MPILPSRIRAQCFLTRAHPPTCVPCVGHPRPSARSSPSSLPQLRHVRSGLLDQPHQLRFVSMYPGHFDFVPPARPVVVATPHKRPPTGRVCRRVRVRLSLAEGRAKWRADQRARALRLAERCSLSPQAAGGPRSSRRARVHAERRLLRAVQATPSSGLCPRDAARRGERARARRVRRGLPPSWPARPGTSRCGGGGPGAARSAGFAAMPSGLGYPRPRQEARPCLPGPRCG